MHRLFTLVFSICISVMMVSNTAVAEGPPSKGAEGMPGALGTFKFKPSDWKEGELTWWKDTDGIDPAVAGCHIATDEDGKPIGRSFPEACLDETTLVESNPGIDEVHSHKNDIGNPDKFDCNAWCVGKGSSAGICKAAPAPPCEQESAMCVCS